MACEVSVGTIGSGDSLRWGPLDDMLDEEVTTLCVFILV